MSLVLNAAEREQIIEALIANCGPWTEDDRELLGQMSDESLTDHGKHCVEHRVLNERLSEVTANANAGEIDLSTIDDETLFAEVLERTGGEPSPEEEEMVGNQLQEMTEEQWLAIAPPSIRDVVTNALQFQGVRRNQLIQAITANSRNRFSPERLDEMDTEELEALAELAEQPTANAVRQRRAIYAGDPGLIANQDNGAQLEEPLVMPTLNFERAAR